MANHILQHHKIFAPPLLYADKEYSAKVNKNCENKCALCDIRFISNNALENHVSIKHKAYICETCDLRFVKE